MIGTVSRRARYKALSPGPGGAPLPSRKDSSGRVCTLAATLCSFFRNPSIVSSFLGAG